MVCLYLDMNSHYKYKEILACNTFAEDREDASFIWDNFYDEEERINEYQLCLFIQNEQGTYNKYEELHLQKAYEQEEVVSFLMKRDFHPCVFWMQRQWMKLKKIHKDYIILQIERKKDERLYYQRNSSK